MSKKVLVIGGTRNMGHYLTLGLIEAGHEVTILNRGITPDELPDTIYRLRADRTDPQQMRRALLAKSFDVVVDFTLYKGVEAETMVELLHDSTDHYIFISSGQVYLVREDIERPMKEADYEGRLVPAPKDQTFAYQEWAYGINKRDAEDTFARAWEADEFPYTALRLPMVNSGRDQFNRLYCYLLRLQDGGPILLPETPRHPLRHIYSGDVVSAVTGLIEKGDGKGRAYNISQDETVSIGEFIHLLGDIIEVTPNIARFKRSELEANGFLPDCSPFSERWMSELDNTLSKEELGMTYTPLPDYLETIVRHYANHPVSPPVSYNRRHAELQMVKMMTH